MAYFGCDGDNTAGTTVGSTPNPFAYDPVQNVLWASGGVPGVAGTPTHVSLWFTAPGASISEPTGLIVGVYKGGTDAGTHWTPVGATKIGETALIAEWGQGATLAWHTWELTGTAAWGATDRVWLVVGGQGANAVRNRTAIVSVITGNYPGDFTQKTGTESFHYLYGQSAYDMTSGLPATYPSGGVGNNYPLIGYITYSSGASVVISSVSDATLANGQSGIIITGTGFGATKGAGSVIISPSSSDPNDAGAVTQTANSGADWSDTSIQFTAVKGGLSLLTNAYVFVKDNAGVFNATGYGPIQFWDPGSPIVSYVRPLVFVNKRIIQH